MTESRIRVMAVDNCPEMCEILETLIGREADLEWVGHAEDGLQGLEEILKRRPDVVLLDVIMPHLDGLALLERLVEMELPKKPKVIILTAAGDQGIIRQCSKLGVGYYLLKPFDAASLVSRVRDVARNAAPTMLTRDHTPIRQPAADAPIQVARLLFRLGVPTYFKGYQYLRDAIEMVAESAGCLPPIAKTLYLRIAEKHGTTPLVVEAAIRYTIQKTWELGDRDYLRKLFRTCADSDRGRVPTNSSFIARAAEEMKARSARLQV